MIFYVAGGTGGHLFPAIAIHQELQTDATFIVPRKQPAWEILDKYDISPIIFPISKSSMFFFPIILLKTIKLVKKHKPKMIIIMGGSVCIPFAMIGWLFRIPTLAFEQNVIPGRAIRVCQFFANKIITSFESTRKYLRMKNKVNCLGNPIRIDYPFTDSLPKEWQEIQGKTVLVIGGSQGARAINQYIIENKKNIMESGWNIIHLTGELFFNDKDDNYIIDSVGEKVYIALPFLSNMNLAYEKTSVVISRSGATTLAELNAYQIPALLIPYPFAMDNHQMKNAIEFSAINEVMAIVKESELKSAQIIGIIDELYESAKEKVMNINKSKTNYICEFIKTYLK